MPSKAEQLAALLTAGLADYDRGAILYQAQAARRRGDRRTETYLRTILDTPRPTATPPARHPKDHAPGGGPRKVALTDSDRMWLDRLPRDPRDITLQDAAALAGLSKSLDRMANPSDARLLDSIWGPVDALHARRVAQEQLAYARRPLPVIPPGGEALIAEALSEELASEFTPDEIHGRAVEMLRSSREWQAAMHAQSIDRAESTIAALAAGAAQAAQFTP